jgi:hypothetical protein
MATDLTDFYVVIAGAIPVLFVVYALSLSSFAKKTFVPEYERKVKESMAAFLDLLGSTTATGRLGVAWQRFVGFVRRSKSWIFLFAYFGAVVVPVGGEFAALYALGTETTPFWTEAVSVAGIAVAFAAVVIPLMVLGFQILPFSTKYAFWRGMEQTQTRVKAIYKEWGESKAASPWADRNITIARIEQNNNVVPIDVSDPSKVGPNAWGGEWPKWVASYFTPTAEADRYGLLVGDSVNGSRRATLFTVKDDKVIAIRVYDDRGHAEARHPSLSGKGTLDVEAPIVVEDDGATLPPTAG